MRTTSVFINKLSENGFPFSGKVKFTLMSTDPDYISHRKPVEAFFINGKAKVQLIPNIFISRNVSTYYHYQIFAQHPVNSPTEIDFELVEEGDCIVPIKPSCLQEILIPTQQEYEPSGSNCNCENSAISITGSFKCSDELQEGNILATVTSVTVQSFENMQAGDTEFSSTVQNLRESSFFMGELKITDSNQAIGQTICFSSDFAEYDYFYEPSPHYAIVTLKINEEDVSVRIPLIQSHISFAEEYVKVSGWSLYDLEFTDNYPSIKFYIEVRVPFNYEITVENSGFTYYTLRYPTENDSLFANYGIYEQKAYNYFYNNQTKSYTLSLTTQSSNNETTTQDIDMSCIVHSPCVTAGYGKFTEIPAGSWSYGSGNYPIPAFSELTEAQIEPLPQNAIIAKIDSISRDNSMMPRSLQTVKSEENAEETAFEDGYEPAPRNER